MEKGPVEPRAACTHCCGRRACRPTSLGRPDSGWHTGTSRNGSPSSSVLQTRTPAQNHSGQSLTPAACCSCGWQSVGSTPASVKGDSSRTRSGQQFTRLKDRHRRGCSPVLGLQASTCPPPARGRMITHSPAGHRNPGCGGVGARSAEVPGPLLWVVRTWRGGGGVPSWAGPMAQCPGRFQELNRIGSWESSGLFPSG